MDIGLTTGPGNYKPRDVINMQGYYYMNVLPAITNVIRMGWYVLTLHLTCNKNTEKPSDQDAGTRFLSLIQ